MNPINEKIRTLRKNQNLTQDALGAQLGISGQAVAKWEKGESLPDILLLPDLCKILSTSADALLEVESFAKASSPVIQIIVNTDDADNAMRFELGNMDYAKACMNLDYNEVAWYLSVLTNEAVFKTLTTVPSDSGNSITQTAICAQTRLPKAEVETALRILLKRNMISEADSNQHSADSDFEEPRYRQDYCGLCGIYMILAACKEHIDAKNAQKTETTIIRD